MIIATRFYKGLHSYCLENEEIRLVLLPDLGTKIASLVYKPQSFEVFSQPTGGGYKLAEYGACFADYDTSGADEMFPTVDSCSYPYPGYRGVWLPDHGELWSIPWEVTEISGGLLSEARGRVLPYVFARTISLFGSTVQLKYKVENMGDKPLYGLWAFHGLVACDEATSLILPEIEKVINVQNSKLLGAVGTKHSYPVTVTREGRQYRLDKVGTSLASKTEKIYVDGVAKKGEAALTLNQGRLMYRLVFPVNKVPYLGVWINEGGFKGEYNCALEPSTGYYDSLEVAHQIDSAQPLAPGETMEWHLAIELSPLPNAYTNSNDIMDSAWRWHQANPDGLADKEKI